MVCLCAAIQHAQAMCASGTGLCCLRRVADVVSLQLQEPGYDSEGKPHFFFLRIRGSLNCDLWFVPSMCCVRA